MLISKTKYPVFKIESKKAKVNYKKKLRIREFSKHYLDEKNNKFK